MAVVDQLMVLFWIFFCRVVDERSDVSEGRSSSLFRVNDSCLIKTNKIRFFHNFFE